jgi:hypothetical protein
MLAPFTAGWQSNDLHPLIIEKSEVVALSSLFGLHHSEVLENVARMQSISYFISQ